MMEAMNIQEQVGGSISVSGFVHLDSSQTMTIKRFSS